jgi:hypothetical protein
MVTLTRLGHEVAVLTHSYRPIPEGDEPGARAQP